MAEAPPSRDAQPLGWLVLLPPWLSELVATPPSLHATLFPWARSRQPESKGGIDLGARPQARARALGLPHPGGRGPGGLGEVGVRQESLLHPRLTWRTDSGPGPPTVLSSALGVLSLPMFGHLRFTL